jgi:hypothetical protein
MYYATSVFVWCVRACVCMFAPMQAATSFRHTFGAWAGMAHARRGSRSWIWKGFRVLCRV